MRRQAPHKIFHASLWSLSLSPCLNSPTSLRPQTWHPWDCEGFTTCALSAQTEPKIAPHPPSPTLFASCASFSQTISQDLVLLPEAPDAMTMRHFSLHCDGPMIAQFSQGGIL